ncbi:VOC family protein [Gorillibacterium timonense]|uniref:VOC family protein n=1 Tax=Gorillibacterium timonense TaxID=1689269 RepID=UPI00071C7888|nr:VOC family protein [Gorillibacterium timonense]
MQIGAVTFFVNDMEKMVGFYRDVMKMEIEWDGGSFTGVRMENRVFFNLCQRNEGDKARFDYHERINGTMEISFGVPTPEDVDVEFERLVQAGATPVNQPVSQPYGLRDSAVADPEGNLIEIVAALPEE